MTSSSGKTPMNTSRALVAGLIGTLFATALWVLEPAFGLPELAVGQILSHLIAVVTAYFSPGPVVGWAIHVFVGLTLALTYARLFVGRLRGAPVVRGLMFGCLIFVMAQLVFTPLVGAGVFSRGDVPMLVGSLLGHLLYGGILGAVYGLPQAA